MTAGPDHIAASLWHATAKERFEAPAATGDITADLAIIGGGFLGLSTALHAAEAGLSTILVEAGSIGDGASGRNGGLVVPSLPRVGPSQAIATLGARGKHLVSLVAGGARHVFDLIAKHHIACDAFPSGWLHPAHAASLVPNLRARMEDWQTAEASVTWLEADEARDRIGSQRFHGAMFDSTGGHLNPLAYARGLARAASTVGAQIHERSPAKSIRRDKGQWLIETDAATIRAPRVIQATNAQMPDLRGGAKVRRSTVPLIVYQMATPVLPEAVRADLLPGRESLSDTRNNLFAVRWTADHRIVIGGMAPISQAAGATRVPRRAVQRLNATFPQLSLDCMDHVWRARATLTGDFLPRLFQPAPGWLAPIACNGRGIVLTTLLGRALARFAVDGDEQALPLPMVAPKPIKAQALARLIPQLLLPLGMIADRRAESRQLGRG
ncbi:MAG: FAD-binding oxidoreductase [Pseudomonadota bacterium]